jgi:hypothetical protein
MVPAEPKLFRPVAEDCRLDEERINSLDESLHREECREIQAAY